ncbi:hypothetical protein WJX73_007761 [Symbiochloris irregularis]|uniref:Uncharacterized protein n=1 Tax=Symbiochloris irregularis TaxID=706552 RepID=A0AAW1PBX2_9CHLO
MPSLALARCPTPIAAERLCVRQWRFVPCHSQAAGADIRLQDSAAGPQPESDERLSPWQRLLRLLLALWQGVLSLISAVFARLSPPKAASLAEARSEAQKGQGQRKLGSSNIQSKEYKMALARTRQHVSIQKALQLQRQAIPARAEVELQRALAENAVCRAPLLAANYTKEQMLGLYKLHLENTELPPNYAQLLQLRDMLELDAAEAEQLEEDVMSNAAQFSI